MCGIAGYVRPLNGDPTPHAVLRMTRALRHRGPDDEGLALIHTPTNRTLRLTTSESAPGIPLTNRAESTDAIPHDIALGHRRFSIVDLSPAGHQPFWSDDSVTGLVFNGEIYNHVELRQQLSALGIPFRTCSDTEVLLKSYLHWGEACFTRFVGFWAIALYDARRRQLLLSRDRLGKAPLYLTRRDGSLYFASEIPALLAATGRDTLKVRDQSVADFMAHSWRDVHDTTFYDNISTFPAGAYQWLSAHRTEAPVRYWSLPTTRLSESDITPDQAATAFRTTLDDAVRVRMRADVPIGFELSGGVDSSCLVASAASQGFSLHAYTVSFPGTPSDEEPYARAVAARYPKQVEYTVMQPPAEDFWEQANDYVARMAEPFHAPNILTNRNIWQHMARQGIKVSLNGAAGDESWAGYFNDYFTPFLRQMAREGNLTALLREARLFGDTPQPLTSATFWRRIKQAFSTPDPTPGVSSLGSQLHPFDPSLDPLRLTRHPSPGPRRDLHNLMLDLMGPWRMNYWLRSGNQSYMTVPTEVRCPFLDHRLVELAFRLPVTYLIRDGWLKWLVRKAMSDRLPPEVTWRKRKMGFPFPYAQWAAASQDRFFRAIGPLDCPYVNLPKLRNVYPSLARSNPLYLWRAMSVCLWWKRCVLNEPLGT